MSILFVFAFHSITYKRFTTTKFVNDLFMTIESSKYEWGSIYIQPPLEPDQSCTGMNDPYPAISYRLGSSQVVEWRWVTE
jgi:hypothetical protein